MVQDTLELTEYVPANGTLAGDGWETHPLAAGSESDRRGVAWTPDDRAGPIIRVEQQGPNDWTLTVETQGGTDLGTTRYTQAAPAVIDADHEAGRIDESIGRVRAEAAEREDTDP